MVFPLGLNQYQREERGSDGSQHPPRAGSDPPIPPHNDYFRGV